MNERILHKSNCTTQSKSKAKCIQCGTVAYRCRLYYLYHGAKELYYLQGTNELYCDFCVMKRQANPATYLN